MAEAEKDAAHEEHGREHEHEEAEGPPKPEEHIQDKVLVGLNANGEFVSYPYDHEGHPKNGYEPKVLLTVLGKPLKIEFTKHMAGMGIVATLIFVIGVTVARRVLAGLQTNKAPKGALANAFEAVVVFVRDEMVEPMGGHHLGHYTPIFITYFVLILLCNLVGLIPEVGTATGNFSITAGLALSVYALIWILGMYNQGPINFIVHLVPPGTPWWLWPLMFVLELLGPVIKCFVLSVRLYANMIAGHLIIGSILNLGVIGAGPVSASLIMLGIGIPLSLGLSFLEVMVCFIQAFVFTLLSVIFIGAAVHPEH
jgi:F-type H+-transporting ATPase subunit a